jgi:hypothetical protein
MTRNVPLYSFLRVRVSNEFYDLIGACYARRDSLKKVN